MYDWRRFTAPQVSLTSPRYRSLHIPTLEYTCVSVPQIYIDTLHVYLIVRHTVSVMRLILWLGFYRNNPNNFAEKNLFVMFVVICERVDIKK